MTDALIAELEVRDAIETLRTYSESATNSLSDDTCQKKCPVCTVGMTCFNQRQTVCTTFSRVNRTRFNADLELAVLWALTSTCRNPVNRAIPRSPAKSIGRGGIAL